MIVSSYLYCNPCWDLLLVNFDNNKLANGFLEVFTESSYSLVPIFYIFTLSSAPIFVIFSTNNKLFKKFIEIYLAV